MSCAKYVNIYTVQSASLIVFVSSAIIFSLSSATISYAFGRSNLKKVATELEDLNYNAIAVFYLAISCLSMPFIVSAILSQGETVVEIAYNLRVAALNNDAVLHPVLSYFFVFSLSLSLIMLYGVLIKNFRLSYFILLFLPFVVTMLLINGRSGLVSLILSWFFAYLFLGRRLTAKAVFLFIFLLFAIIFLGAVFVSKVDVDKLGAFEVFLVIFEHILDYYLQGIVLFDLYYSEQIHVQENWDALNVLCQILSAFDMCQPLPQHQDVAQFGDGKLGNVYSIYFSILPRHGILGLFFFILLYGVLSGYFYEVARRGYVYSYVVSCFIFSFIVLSLFHDGFGYSLILLIQTLFFVYVVILLFGKTFTMKMKKFFIISSR